LGDDIIKRSFIVFFSFFSICLANEKLSEHVHYQEYSKLDDIIKNKYIRFLTTHSAFDYYITEGKHKGYQYEIAKEFVKYLNKKYIKKNELKIQFEMIPVSHSQLIPSLIKGQGELIAANLTQTHLRENQVSFSIPLRKTNEIIITRKENQDKVLWKKKIAVRKHSSFFQHIKSWNEKYPERFLQVDYVNPKLEIENIIELLSYGKYEYAMIDSHVYDLTSELYPNIVKSKTQPFEERKTTIAWALRTESQKLLKEVNSFVPKVRKGTRLGNIFHNKYFDDLSLIVSSREKGEISDFDKTIKKYAKIHNWDWRLLVSLCFQESRFKADIINKWGAIGLFQIKLSTANEPYVNVKNIKGIKNYKNNIKAGVRYITWLRDKVFKDIKGKNRIRFAIAAYNSGPGRFKKARKLAKKMNLNPNVWFRNVELAFIKMRNLEPVKYVSEINKRYTSYILMGF